MRALCYPDRSKRQKTFDFRAQDLNNAFLGCPAYCVWDLASHLAYGSSRPGMASASSSFTAGIRRGWLRLLGFLRHRMPGFFSRLFSCCFGSDLADERHSAALTVPLKPPASPAQANSETAVASGQSVADHNPLADITNRSTCLPPQLSQGKPFQDVETGTAVFPR